MAAGKYNFKIEQGATLDFEVRYTDSNGDPVDFTDYDHARMQIRSDYGGTQIIYLSSSIGGLPPDYGSPDSPTSDGTGLSLSGSSKTEPITSGKIGVYISAQTSSAFTFNEAKYDLELVSGSNDPTTGQFPVVTRLLEGRVKLKKEITI